MEAIADFKKVSSQRSVYRTICYFDIFGFPLKAEEVREYCNEKITKEELDQSLKALFDDGKIRQSKGFYFLSQKDEACIRRRVESESHLTQKLSVIKRYAKFVNAFPFVEATFISGSVSKGILDRSGDVDYFIICRPGRVWLCRTLLIAFKKIVLLNSRKYFCVNYFIDSNNLEVPDHNLFVATEIKTLLPVYQSKTAIAFEKVNDWVKGIFPNADFFRSPLVEGSERKPFFGRMTEKFFSGDIGEKLDAFFFKMTLKRWQKKFPHFNQQEFDLNMRSYRHVSKHHPQGHQHKVLSALAERMNHFSGE